MKLKISYGIERECAFFSQDGTAACAARTAARYDKDGIYRGTSAYMDVDHYEIITLPAYNLTDAVRSAWDIDARQRMICNVSDGNVMAFKGNTTSYLGATRTFATHDNFLVGLDQEITTDYVAFDDDNALSNMVMARGILCGEGGCSGGKICHSPRMDAMIYFDMRAVEVKDEYRVHINASMDNCSPISTGLRLILGGIIAAYMYTPIVKEESVTWPKSTSDTKKTIEIVRYLKGKVEQSRLLPFSPPNTDIALYLLGVIEADLEAGRVPLYLDWGAKHAYLMQFAEKDWCRAEAEDINWCRLDRESTWHRLRDHCLSDPRVEMYVKLWTKSRRFRGLYAHVMKRAIHLRGGYLEMVDNSYLDISMPLNFLPSNHHTTNKNLQGRCIVLPYRDLNRKPIIGHIHEDLKGEDACVVKVGENLIKVKRDRVMPDNT